MLSLAEDLILLALDDETGTFFRLTDINFSLALVGALFMDLAIRGRIDIDAQNLFVVSREETGDPLLDKTLQLISSPECSCNTTDLIRNVYNAIPGLKDSLLQSLFAKGIVEQKEEKILWLFNHRRYPVINDTEEQEVLSRIRSSVLQERNPDSRDIVLIALLGVCDLLEKIFTREELNTHRERIEFLKSMDLISHAVNKIIAEIQMMIASSYIA